MLLDTFLDATARFRGQLLNTIGSTTGAPGGQPNMVQKLTPKSRHSIEERVKKHAQKWSLFEDVSSEMKILPTFKHRLGPHPRGW